MNYLLDTCVILEKHREQDQNQTNIQNINREKKFVETLGKRMSKIREWLSTNDDKPGKTSKPRKSNITDNESAKMKLEQNSNI
ncbi:MAG: transposase IS4 family protein [bacterium]|nr:MAG: transposase IS4 family protein [bacterium]